MQRVLILDSTRVFAEALAVRLRAEPAVGSVDLATDVDDAIRLLTDGACEVVLADYASAIDLLGEAPARLGLRAPWVIVLADERQTPGATAAIQAGASGWVSRADSVTVLLDAIDAVVRGGSWVAPDLLTGVLAELQRPRHTRTQRELLLARLTDRQADVLRCLELGLARRDIAARLHVSTNTVRTHVEHILRRLEVRSVLAAVALLHQQGTLPAEQRTAAAAGQAATIGTEDPHVRDFRNSQPAPVR